MADSNASIDSNASNSKPTTVTCHCQPTRLCPHHQPICISTTGCFHSLTLDLPNTNLVREETFGCFPNHTNQIDLHCRDQLVSNPLVYCCSVQDGDYCNRDLGPLLPRKVAGFGIFEQHNWMSVVLVILLPIMTLVGGLFAIGLFWKFVLKTRLARLERFNPEDSFRKSNTTAANNIKLRGCCSDCLKRVYLPGCVWTKTRSSINKTSFRLVSARKDESSSSSPYELMNYTSGSGSGLPFLVQKTIARHVRLLDCIGKGRYGEVWRATCQGELVAVKIFSSRDEASWARETEVYNTGLLRHPNILAYYASDMISRAGCTQLWLITAYHANGSLHDYLNMHSVKLSEGLRLASSIASGLAFLHSGINGLHAKPPIAHRDLKSKNVLVMSNHEACIADLGLALVQSPNWQSCILGNNQPSSASVSTSLLLGSAAAAVGVSGSMPGPTPLTSWHHWQSGFSGPSSIGPPPAGPRVGTKRYMAPELLMTAESRMIRQPTLYADQLVLSSTRNDSCEDLDGLTYLPFEIYQAADIYALALVFWEIGRCTQGVEPGTEQIDGYQIPFQDVVPTDPTFAQMRKIVCADMSPSPHHQENSDVQPGVEANVPSPDHNSCRPPISPRWLQDPYLNRYSKIIQECWHRDWSVRLSALRIRKRLEQLETSLREQTGPVTCVHTSNDDDSNNLVRLINPPGLQSSPMASNFETVPDELV